MFYNLFEIISYLLYYIMFNNLNYKLFQPSHCPFTIQHLLLYQLPPRTMEKYATFTSFIIDLESMLETSDKIAGNKAQNITQSLR